MTPDQQTDNGTTQRGDTHMQGLECRSVGLRDTRAGEADVSVPFELWVIGRMTASFARRAGQRGPSAQPV